MTQKTKQKHLILFQNHAKMLEGFEGRSQSNGYATVRMWAGGVHTPTYTVHELLPCGVWKETLYKHEQEDWQMDVAGMQFYGLTIFADTSPESIRWALSRVRGLWDD